MALRRHGRTALAGGSNTANIGLGSLVRPSPTKEFGPGGLGASTTAAAARKPGKENVSPLSPHIAGGGIAATNGGHDSCSLDVLMSGDSLHLRLASQLTTQRSPAADYHHGHHCATTPHHGLLSSPLQHSDPRQTAAAGGGHGHAIGQPLHRTWCGAARPSCDYAVTGTEAGGSSGSRMPSPTAPSPCHYDSQQSEDLDLELRLFAALQPQSSPGRSGGGAPCRQGRPIPSVSQEAPRLRFDDFGEERNGTGEDPHPNRLRRRGTGFVRVDRGAGQLLAALDALDDEDDDEENRGNDGGDAALRFGGGFHGCFTDSWKEAVLLDLSLSRPIQQAVTTSPSLDPLQS